MLHLKKTYESKINNFMTIDMMNRGILVNVKDEDTSKNSTLFGLGLVDELAEFGEPVPMDIEPVHNPLIQNHNGFRRVRNQNERNNTDILEEIQNHLMTEINHLGQTLDTDNEVSDNEVDGYGTIIQTTGLRNL